MQALKPNMRHLISCLKVVSIKHTTSALFLLLFCRSENGKCLYGLDINKSIFLFKISASGLF